MPRHPALLATTALIVFLHCAASGSGQAPSVLPFRNPDLPIEQRIDDLIARLTLEEKVSLMIDRAASVDRLGIPAFPWWNEALHGVARAGRATVFPQAIGLAATWDVGLMQRVATAISDEARAMNNRWTSRGLRHIYQGLVFWSPNINIFRDPRWGRGQETYGEDPVLTGSMGVAFVKGMQGDHPRYLKTVATPKHFAVHSGPEPLRHTFDAKISEVDLRETYLPAFRATVIEGRAESVMCAYNAVGGLPACGSPELLQKILRTEWGFGGYVVSDCGAVQDIYENHKARKTAAEAAAMALMAGTDVECGSGSWAPGSPDAFLTLADAVPSGLASEQRLDAALRRLLKAQMRLGVYDPPDRVPFTRLAYENVVNSPAHRDLALEAARKSIVLLKNERRTLPLPAGLGTIAVIGPTADDVEVLLGNYNGTPVAPVTILAGIKAAAGPQTRILHARGAPLAAGIPDLRPVPSSALFTARAAGRENGLSGAYYGPHFHGAPVLTRIDPTIEFDWADGSPGPGLESGRFSVRWTGELRAPVTGRYAIGFRGATAFRVLIGNKVVAQGRTDHEPTLATGQVTMRAGRAYPIRVEYEHEKYDAVGTLLWDVPGGDSQQRDEALAATRAADAVVLVLGLSSRLEGEEMSVRIDGFDRGDRTSLDLPAPQQSLLEAVVREAAAKPVVLVLLSGSAIAVNWASEHVPAILEAWYPGQTGGAAVGDVLFGRVSPGGRLPVTFYRSVDQLPPFDDYAMKGRTYRYFDGEPLFPFGHGLSYSRFTYSDLVVPASLPIGASAEISVRVQNTGDVAADEVIQVYVTRPHATTPVPRHALKAFARVPLEPTDARTVRFTLSERDFSVVLPAGDRVVEPGRVTIAVGGMQPLRAGSSQPRASQVLTATMELKGTTARLKP